MRNSHKGFSVVEVILVLLVIVIVGFLGWQVFENSKRPTAGEARPMRIVAVGDIACEPQDNRSDPANCQDERVAQQIKAINPDALLLLGDIQYSDGTLEKFQRAFDKNWGGFKNITYPAPGNHEYNIPGASGYYTYFKDAPIDVSRGYYGVTLGDWRIISLNSNCDKVNCAPGSEQAAWLEAELNEHQTMCRLAFWHHPRFTSGNYAANADSKNRSDTFWPKLEAYKTDVVLSGHDHLYERFAPQAADGKASVNGPRQFTVGTGGKSHYKSTGVAANSEKIIDDQYGVLVLDLYKDSYAWEFRSTDSQILDRGRRDCR
ncbi:MAG TPA: metallophosphoesterase [Magnetospirillaceae bacterium]|nr:metallophosphoesterase [Magnetospirillaceae bacterium]